MKRVTSVTFWNDAVGVRMSITYSEIDERTGKLIKDNERVDHIVLDQAEHKACSDLTQMAQAYINTLE